MGDIEIPSSWESVFFRHLPTYCLLMPFSFSVSLTVTTHSPITLLLLTAGYNKRHFFLHAALSDARSSLCPYSRWGLVKLSMSLGLMFISATRVCVSTSFSSGVAEGNALSVHSHFWRMLADYQPGLVWTAHGCKTSMRSVLESHSKGSSSSPWKLPSIIIAP